MSNGESIFQKVTGPRSVTAERAMAMGGSAASLLTDRVADALDALREDPHLYRAVAAQLGAAIRYGFDD